MATTTYKKTVMPVGNKSEPKKLPPVKPTPPPTTAKSTQTAKPAQPTSQIPDWMRQEIRKKAESGVALDKMTPEKQKIYDEAQARTKELIAQKARDGVGLDSGNAYKDGLYKEASMNLTPNDKAYYNPNNVMMRQTAESDARMQAMEGKLQQGAEAQMQSQEALLSQARDQKILDLQKALEDAVTEGKISVRDAEAQFEDQKKVIEQEAYQDTNRTELSAQSRGIQNSQQMLGMMSADNMRKNGMINENMTTRDRRINDITDRLNNIKNKSALDMAGANADFGYGMANAQGQVDAQMYQNLFNAGMQNSQQLSQQQFSLDQMGAQQKYNQQNMQTQHNFDLAKMDKQQVLQLEQMAKQFGFDLQKMDKQSQIQFAQMAQAFMNSSALQNDAQSHDANMQYNSQMFQEAMFGKEQAQKLVDYDLALQRELASFDPNTPEGKIRAGQLQSSRDAVMYESQAKLMADVMGKTFADTIGNPPVHPGKGASSKEIDKYNQQVEAWNGKIDGYMNNPQNMNSFITKMETINPSQATVLKEAIGGAINNSFSGALGTLLGKTVNFFRGTP